jgi:hypothetical protein
MKNKNKVYKTIVLRGLASRNACISKNTGQTLAKDKVTDSGFKSLLSLVV